MRVSRHQMLMGIARVAAQRSTCHRLNVGAVLATDQGSVRSIGYNGASSGMAHCGGTECVYMTDKGCSVIHAEHNALDHLIGPSTDLNLYVTHSPCMTCTAKLIMHGIKRVFYEVEYRDVAPLTRLTTIGIEVYRLTPSGYLYDRRADIVHET